MNFLKMDGSKGWVISVDRASKVIEVCNTGAPGATVSDNSQQVKDPETGLYRAIDTFLYYSKADVETAISENGWLNPNNVEIPD